MGTKKIIFITAGIAFLVAGTSFYFLFWRKRKGVSKEDAQKLSEFTVEEDKEIGSDAGFKHEGIVI